MFTKTYFQAARFRLARLHWWLVLCALALAPIRHTAAQAGAIPPPLQDAAPTFDPALAHALDQVLDQSVATAAIPGIIVSVTVPGQGAWIGVRGVSDREQGTPMLPTERFLIASITKLFVSTVAMQLVQEGWLALDQNVEQWLPGLLPNGNQITVRELMNHTSGLANYLDDAFLRMVEAAPERVWAPQELVAYAAQRRPLFAPGAPGRWYYSNTNYVLLGLIIEQATHAPLDREIHHRIIDRLGLKDTFFAPADAVAGTMARGYAGRKVSNLAGANLSYAWGVGNMIATVADLTRFAQALFWGELLRPEMLHTMLTSVSTNGIWGEPNLGYGLGMMRDVLGTPNPLQPDGGLVFGHTGGLAGYRSALWYMPASGITLAIAINRMGVDPNRVIAQVIDVLVAHRDLH